MILTVLPGPALGQVSTQSDPNRDLPTTQQADTDTRQADSETVPPASVLPTPILTFEDTLRLLRQPGYHPELLELFELGSRAADNSLLPTAAPAALKAVEWIWIGVGIFAAAMLIVYVACTTGDCVS